MGNERINCLRKSIINRGMPILCQIIQELSFSRKLDEYSKVFDRMGDVHTGIDWLLCQNPIQGTEILTKYRIMKTTPIANTPSFWVLYSYSQEENTVRLLSIQVVDSEDKN